ncbi:hypothetical protein ABI59_19325 [Acidobacteria bacterium Mor1]|nr:hypothetical protein ABI59_19325 [Acidobacteria bacterium Mor1]
MAQPQEKHPLVTRVIRIGWVCVAVSALFLYLSGSLPAEGGDVMQWALLLMVARLFGLASFTIGAVAIYNRRFGEGIALFGVSIALPVLSFLLHGTL